MYAGVPRVDPGLGDVHVLARVSGQSEVEDLDSADRRLQPDIGRLDVAVDQAALVGGGQAGGHLAAQPQHQVDRRLAPRSSQRYSDIP